MKTQLKRQTKRRGMTLTEFAVAAGIFGLVTVPVTGTFIMVLRMYATASNQSLTRLGTDRVIRQLNQDIRNTTRGRYNDLVLNRLKNSTPVFEATESTPPMLLTLVDTTQGQRIFWTYDWLKQRVSRRVQRFLPDGTETNDITNYPQEFVDFRLAETTRADVGAVGDQTITGIRIWGRVFLSLDPYHTTYQEIDGATDDFPVGDGLYRNDRVGAELFGRPDEGDDPIWQYIFNVQATFRNT